MSQQNHPTVTMQINQRVDLLAELLSTRSESLRAMQSIGVALDIPLGVRQRLIELYGSEARGWLGKFDIET